MNYKNIMILLYNINNNKLEEIDNNKIIDEIYHFNYRIPNQDDIKEYKKKHKDNKFIEYINKYNINELINKIKIDISKIDNKIPLYDEYTKNIYIVNKEDVYNKVIYNSYRFPNKYLLEKLKKKYSNFKLKKNEGSNLDDIKKNREYKKLQQMIEFLEQFDNETLYMTYMKVFYLYSNEVGKNITICTRPSFVPYFKHIKPYYNRNELINLGLNMQIIKPSDIYYDDNEINKLCNKIIENDISAKVILEHQTHILESNGLGIIQYYTFVGSFFMNQYLRNLVNYKYKNEILEDNIKLMQNLIRESPEFDKSYIVYRFVKSDDYIKHLKIGDEYVIDSFLSTTRNPFFKSQEYELGYILIKIKIPEKTKGIGLLVETLSNFPTEEEIILPIGAVLKLDSRDNNTLYYHPDNKFGSKFKTRYEFTYIDNKLMKINERPIYENIQTIDFLKIQKSNSLNLIDRINFFINRYVDPKYQFKTKIGNKIYTIINEWYDSIGAYRNFYAMKTNNGYSLYTIINGYIGFFIEIGEDDITNYMHVNYYYRFSSIPSNEDRIKSLDLIEFISKIAYYFEISNVILYCEYQSCSLNSITKNKLYNGGNYCIDIYNFLKSNIKKFIELKLDSTELHSNFSYYELSRLKNIDPLTILNKEDNDDIFIIYTKTYQISVNNSKYNCADFYIWLIENYCVYVDLFVSKIYKLFNYNNPFINDSYLIDSISFLYNRNLIVDYITFSSEKIDITPKVIENINLPKNRYRLE